MNKEQSRFSRGGHARAAKLTPEQRSAVAAAGAAGRWAGRQVYVIGSMDGPQKIGVGVDPVKRRTELQTGNPHALDVSFTYLPDKGVNGTAIEREAHRILEDERLAGEWFDVTPEVARCAVLAAVEAAKSIAHLPVPPTRPKRGVKAIVLRMSSRLVADVDELAVRAGVSRQKILLEALLLGVKKLEERPGDVADRAAALFD